MKYECKNEPKIRYVPYLEDLMQEQDYEKPGNGKVVKIKITVNDQGVEVLGDSMYAKILETLLTEAGVKEIQKMLCG